MSEELRPLSAYTSEELLRHLASRFEFGIYAITVGDPSAAESFRARKKMVANTTAIGDFMYTRDGVLDREIIEEIHRCVRHAIGSRIGLFVHAFGVAPRCYGDKS